MRYIYYIFLPIILLMSGCAGNSQLIPDDEISFDAYIFFDPEIVLTKGNLLNDAVLPAAASTSFGVFGYRPDGSHVFGMYSETPTGSQLTSAFDNVAVMYRPEDRAAFIYDALALWERGAHDFYAYYPYENPKGAAISNISYEARPYIVYQQPVTLASMTDVLTAAALAKTATDNDAQPIQLKFEHRLFAFDVILKNEQSETARNFRINQAVIEFMNVRKEAAIYFDDDGNTTDLDTYPDLVLKSEILPQIAHVFDLPEDFVIEAPGSEVEYIDYNLNEDCSFLFPPCTELQVKFTLSFLNFWGEECSFTIDRTIKPEGGFQPGYKYAFVVSKKDNGEEIEFETSLRFISGVNGNHWDRSEEINLEFN